MPPPRDICYKLSYVSATLSQLSGNDELPYELSSECGASCLLNAASCLLNVGRVVLGGVFFGASCLGASCLWGELSVIRVVLGQFFIVPHIRLLFTISCACTC